MTATAALIAATLLAVPFWPTTGGSDSPSDTALYVHALTALQEVSDVPASTAWWSVDGLRGDTRHRVGGEPHREVPLTDGHPCEVAGACYVWDLDATSPAIPITKDEGEFAVRVWLGCEVRGPVLTPYIRLADVPNGTGSGAMGQAQVMPLHAPRMASMGLDWNMEYHRVLYAFSMYRASGDRPWSCAR